MKKPLLLTLLLLTGLCSATFSMKGDFPELKGWQKQDTIRTYNPNTLWDFINGGADVYLKYNFNKLRVAEYKNDAGKSFTVEIYRHNTPKDAYGIYASERPTSIKMLNIGDEGYAEPGIFNFLADAYYVKLRSHSSDKNVNQAMETAAQKVASNLEADGKFPAEAACFPKEYRKEPVVTYSASNFMGYKFLHSAFNAEYRHKKSKWQTFLIVLDSQSACKDMLNKYFSFLKQDKTPQTGYFKVEDPYNGIVHLHWQDNYIAGIYNAKKLKAIKPKLKNILNCAQ